MHRERRRLRPFRQQAFGHPPAPLQPHHGEDDDQREQRRHAADAEKDPEIEVAHRAEQDVLRVADQGRGRAGVGRRGQGDRKGPRVEAAALRPGDQQRVNAFWHVNALDGLRRHTGGELLEERAGCTDAADIRPCILDRIEPLLVDQHVRHRDV